METVHPFPSNEDKGNVRRFISDDARKFIIYRFQANKKEDYTNPRAFVEVVSNKNGKAAYNRLNSREE
ncbi:MAG: hypothetical protein ACI35R_16720 [Bacillus sp. (in: firmicutes)]